MERGVENHVTQTTNHGKEGQRAHPPYLEVQSALRYGRSEVAVGWSLQGTEWIRCQGSSADGQGGVRIQGKRHTHYSNNNKNSNNNNNNNALIILTTTTIMIT